MEKIKNDTWRRLLGYDPGPEMKRMILQSVSEEKISLAEVCGRYAMPPVLMGDEECKDYDNPFKPPIRYDTRRRNEK